MPKRSGRKSASQTPAPLKDRIRGSKTNPKGSASSEKSASQIKFDAKTLSALTNKLKEFKDKHPNANNITLADLKAVYRRGSGAYSSTHRPTISGGKPNSRNAWSMARVNKFLLKAGGTKVKKAYVQDDDLMKMHLGGDMSKHLAPNGKPSNLTHEQWHLVRTSEFKAWFGDWENDPENASKVIDENGEPLVVYHGSFSVQSKRRFYVFNKNKKGYKFFAKNKQYSKSNFQGAYGNLYECFLNIRNIVDATEFECGKEYKEDIYKSFYKIYGINYIMGDVGLSQYNERKVKIPFWRTMQNSGKNFYGEKVYEDIEVQLINSKYDGVVYFETSFQTENKKNLITEVCSSDSDSTLAYVVFKSNQIKLADGSNTTFDGSNPDIRYADGGEVVENKETYKKWRSLVNMSYGELKRFYESKEGKEAGLSSSEANKQGIDSGRESARMIMKMKTTPKSDWTPDMWRWAKKQISFISRMSGNKGGLYDDKGNKTRKHTSLLIWGHNPQKKRTIMFELGGMTKNAVIDEILRIAKPYQEELTKKWAVNFEKEFKREPSKIDIEYYEFGLVVDMVKSVGNYIKDGDSIKNIDNSRGRDGSITISCVIERDGTDYPFSTEVILAGGYNIQILHFRYIVKTKLPRTSSNPYYDKLNDERKKLTKIQKLREDLGYAENSIKKYEVKLEEAKANAKLSDAEVEKLSREEDPERWRTLETTWETLIERGADKNYNYDIKEFEKSNKEYRESIIKFWRIFNANAKQYESMISREKKEIDKINKKISELSAKTMEVGGEMDVRMQDTIQRMDNPNFADPSYYAKGGLIAPNGKKSNLTPEQYKLVRTPEFKAWFGDWEKLANAKIKDPAIDEVTFEYLSKNVSKVVDENGEPLVVYHYTNSKDIREFYPFAIDLLNGTKTKKDVQDIIQKWKNSESISLMDFRQGTFFTPKRGSYSSYGENEYACFLKGNFIVNTGDFVKGQKYIGNPSMESPIWYYWNDVNPEIVALYPNQIKLADGSNLTFDGENPDIRFANGGEVDNFKKWFKQSKVVDAKGKPLVVYHGSPDLRGLKSDYVFKPRFDENKSFFFTDSLRMAKSYADPKRAYDYQNAEEGVIGVYLSIQNPLIVDAQNQIWRKFRTEIDGIELVGTAELIKYSKSKNYDGVIVKNVRDYYNNNENIKTGGNVYVAFESTQIKLADGTNSTFSSDNPDIRFKNGGSLFKSHKTIQQIAKEKNVPLSYAKEQLKMGIKVESEHSDNAKVQNTIALQHLDEDMNYYKKLKTIEN
jgi:hypothetical protein